MVEFRNKFKKISEKDINEFRKKYKLPRLPQGYMNFMLDFNGGKSSYDTFLFNIENETNSSIISFFYSISHESDDFRTLNNAMSYIDRYPKGLLPIADDYLGNTICLGIKGKLKNHVYVWIHDMIEEGDKWANIFTVSDSFEHFINSLTKSGVNEPRNVNELHEICKQGEYSKLEESLQRGVDFNELFGLAKICAYFGHLDMIKLLYRFDCPMKWLCIIAIKGKQTETAIYLLDNFENLTEYLPDNSTWLHKAVVADDIELVEYIIQKGFDVNVKDGRGISALKTTLNKEIIALLKHAGAK